MKEVGGKCFIVGRDGTYFDAEECIAVIVPEEEEDAFIAMMDDNVWPDRTFVSGPIMGVIAQYAPPTGGYLQ